MKSLKNGRTWWRFSTGYLNCEPIIKHGFVYAAGEDGTLWALNLWGSDRIAWTYRDDGAFAAPPSLLHGMLYVGDNDGMIHALEAASGKLHWKTKVASADSRSRQLFSNAMVTADRVYVGAADGMLYALNRRDGELLWQHDCGDWIRSRPFCSEGIVCAATLDGNVVAVKDEGNECTELWNTKTGRHPIYADLSGDAEGVIATTSDFQAVALDLRTGNRQWRSIAHPLHAVRWCACLCRFDAGHCSSSGHCRRRSRLVHRSRRVRDRRGCRVGSTSLAI